MKEILWSGPLLVNPNTEQYRMVKATLTYQALLSIPIARTITKLKYLVDKDLYVPIIKLTHEQATEQLETRLLANRKEGIALTVSLILAYLTVN